MYSGSKNQWLANSGLTQEKLCRVTQTILNWQPCRNTCTMKIKDIHNNYSVDWLFYGENSQGNHTDVLMLRKTESDQEEINDFKRMFLFDYGRLVTHPTIKHKYDHNSLLPYLENQTSLCTWNNAQEVLKFVSTNASFKHFHNIIVCMCTSVPPTNPPTKIKTFQTIS